MYKLLKRTILFLLPVLIILIGLSLLFKNLIKNRSDFSLNSSCTTLVLGSSMTECSFNDSLITNTKNLCNGGETYLYTFQKLKNVVENNPQIKTVFISFSNNQIDGKMDQWTYDDEHLNNYFVKYNFNMTADDYKLIMRNNFPGFLKTEVKSIFENAKTIARRKNMLADNNFGGYLHLKRNKLDSLIKAKYVNVLKSYQSDKKSQINIDYLKKIVAFCSEKKINLFFVRTPIHPVLFGIFDENEFQNVRKTNYPKVPFLDFHNFPMTNDEFGDFDHLNYKGAKRFSLFFNELRGKQIFEAANYQQVINSEMDQLKQIQK